MEFAIGGICNCICCMPICSICFVDPAFSELVVSEKANLKNMIRLLSSTNENTLISAMATLYYLMDYPQGLTSSFSFFLLIPSPFEGFCPNRAYYLLHLRECQDSEHGIMHTVSSVPCFQQTHTLSLNPKDLQTGSSRVSSPDCPSADSLFPCCCPASADTRFLLYSWSLATPHTPHAFKPCGRHYLYAVCLRDDHRLDCQFDCGRLDL